MWDAGAQAQLLLQTPAQFAAAGLLPNATCAWNVTLAAFVGDACKVTCYWNSTVGATIVSLPAVLVRVAQTVSALQAQAFAGASCVTAPATSCGCRHLTAFASSSAPTISTCSASDMLSLSPGDIVNKLRTFLIMICGLFGGMHLGAFFAYLLDQRDHHKTLTHLMVPPGDPSGQSCGFQRLGPEGAWTWLLEQTGAGDGDGDGVASEGTADHVYQVKGSFVEAAAVVGLPVARLRMGIPEEVPRSQILIQDPGSDASSRHPNHFPRTQPS